MNDPSFHDRPAGEVPCRPDEIRIRRQAMHDHTHAGYPTIAGTAERQMRRWMLSGEIQRRLDLERKATITQEAHRLGPYITLTREAGAGSNEIARLVAQSLGWEVLDQELL